MSGTISVTSIFDEIFVNDLDTTIRIEDLVEDWKTENFPEYEIDDIRIQVQLTPKKRKNT